MLHSVAAPNWPRCAAAECAPIANKASYARVTCSDGPSRVTVCAPGYAKRAGQTGAATVAFSDTWDATVVVTSNDGSVTSADTSAIYSSAASQFDAPETADGEYDDILTAFTVDAVYDGSLLTSYTLGPVHPWRLELGEVDSYPKEYGYAVVESTTADTDGDTTVDSEDLDDDGDGIVDAEDDFPLDNTRISADPVYWFDGTPSTTLSAGSLGADAASTHLELTATVTVTLADATPCREPLEAFDSRGSESVFGGVNLDNGYGSSGTDSNCWYAANSKCDALDEDACDARQGCTYETAGCFGYLPGQRINLMFDDASSGRPAPKHWDDWAVTISEGTSSAATCSSTESSLTCELNTDSTACNTASAAGCVYATNVWSIQVSCRSSDAEWSGVTRTDPSTCEVIVPEGTHTITIALKDPATVAIVVPEEDSSSDACVQCPFHFEEHAMAAWPCQNAVTGEPLYDTDYEPPSWTVPAGTETASAKAARQKLQLKNTLAAYGEAIRARDQARDARDTQERNAKEACAASPAATCSSTDSSLTCELNTDSTACNTASAAGCVYAGSDCATESCMVVEGACVPRGFTSTLPTAEAAFENSFFPCKFLGDTELVQDVLNNLAVAVQAAFFDDSKCTAAGGTWTAPLRCSAKTTWRDDTRVDSCTDGFYMAAKPAGTEQVFDKIGADRRCVRTNDDTTQRDETLCADGMPTFIEIACPACTLTPTVTCPRDEDCDGVEDADDARPSDSGFNCYAGRGDPPTDTSACVIEWRNLNTYTPENEATFAHTCGAACGTAAYTVSATPTCYVCQGVDCVAYQGPADICAAECSSTDSTLTCELNADSTACSTASATAGCVYSGAAVPAAETVTCAATDACLWSQVYRRGCDDQRVCGAAAFSIVATVTCDGGGDGRADSDCLAAACSSTDSTLTCELNTDSTACSSASATAGCDYSANAGAKPAAAIQTCEPQSECTYSWARSVTVPCDERDCGAQAGMELAEWTCPRDDGQLSADSFCPEASCAVVGSCTVVESSTWSTGDTVTTCALNLGGDGCVKLQGGGSCTFASAPAPAPACTSPDSALTCQLNTDSTACSSDSAADCAYARVVAYVCAVNAEKTGCGDSANCRFDPHGAADAEQNAWCEGDVTCAYGWEQSNPDGSCADVCGWAEQTRVKDVACFQTKTVGSGQGQVADVADSLCTATKPAADPATAVVDGVEGVEDCPESITEPCEYSAELSSSNLEASCECSDVEDSHPQVQAQGSNAKCNACRAVPNAAADAVTTCTGREDSRVAAPENSPHPSGCAGGFYRVAGGAGRTDQCLECAAVAFTRPGEAVDCTSATDSSLASASPCLPGFYHVSRDSQADTCVGCSTIGNSLQSQLVSGADGSPMNRGRMSDWCRPRSASEDYSTVPYDYLRTFGYTIRREDDPPADQCAVVAIESASSTPSLANNKAYYFSPDSGEHVAKYTCEDPAKCTSVIGSEWCSEAVGVEACSSSPVCEQRGNSCVPKAAEIQSPCSTCTNADDSRLARGCAAGYYFAAGESDDAPDRCEQCTDVSLSGGAAVTCTSSHDSRVSSCLPGFTLVQGEQCSLTRVEDARTTTVGTTTADVDLCWLATETPIRSLLADDAELQSECKCQAACTTTAGCNYFTYNMFPSSLTPWCELWSGEAACGTGVAASTKRSRIKAQWAIFVSADGGATADTCRDEASSKCNVRRLVEDLVALEPGLAATCTGVAATCTSTDAALTCALNTEGTACSTASAADCVYSGCALNTDGAACSAESAEGCTFDQPPATTTWAAGVHSNNFAVCASSTDIGVSTGPDITVKVSVGASTTGTAEVSLDHDFFADGVYCTASKTGYTVEYTVQGGLVVSKSESWEETDLVVSCVTGWTTPPSLADSHRPTNVLYTRAPSTGVCTAAAGVVPSESEPNEGCDVELVVAALRRVRIDTASGSALTTSGWRAYASSPVATVGGQCARVLGFLCEDGNAAISTPNSCHHPSGTCTDATDIESGQDLTACSTWESGAWTPSFQTCGQINSLGSRGRCPAMSAAVPAVRAVSDGVRHLADAMRSASSIPLQMLVLGAEDASLAPFDDAFGDAFGDARGMAPKHVLLCKYHNGSAATDSGDGGDDGGGPPDCVAASFEACGEDDDCIAATEAALCAGEIDRSSCSEDDNADIDSHCSTGIEPIIGARSHSVFVTATAVDQITDLKQHDLNDCKVVYTTAPTTSDSTDSADATSVSVDAAITAEAMATAHQRCVASAGRLTLSSDAFAAPVSEAVSEGGSTEEQHEQHDATFTTSMVYYGQLGAAGTDECVAIASLGQIGIVPHESSSRELSELPCYERSASASCSEFNTYDRASGAMQACEDRGAKMCNGRSVPTTMADPRAIQMALQEPAKLAEFTPLCHRDLPRGFKAPGLGTFTGDDSTRETVGGETKGTTDTVWCRGATRSGFDEELSRLSVTMSVKAAEDLFAGLDENSDQSLSAAEFAVFSDTWTRSNAAGNPPLSPALANFGVANGEANFGVAGVCSV